MDRTEIGDHLLEIIESPLLEERLQLIARNYPNLKQELQIRNSILEIFNECNAPVNPHMKAVAEHRVNGKRVDLCFLNQNNLQNPYKVELKFQFTADFNRFEKYGPTIESDFEKRGSDAFLLIIANWDKKEKAEFDSKWNITPNLNRFICGDPSENPLWKDNVCQHINSFDPDFHLEIIEVTEPYPVTYYFYLVRRTLIEDRELLTGEEFFQAIGEE